MPKARAHNAHDAARLQAASGFLPGFSPKKKGMADARRGVASREAAALLEEDPAQDIAALKKSVSSRHGIPFLKNSEILRFIPSGKKELRSRLLKSPTRTLSGISPIAIMPPPFPCPGRCIYCPKGENAPQSYTGFEPTTMRAIECGYSAGQQVRARIRQYSSQGHATDKCHLIIMGGTFLCFPKARMHSFMKGAFDALNGQKSKTLASAIASNETAPRRAIGVTFETRPDFGLEKQADAMLEMGGTQVELGVQALSDQVYGKVLRGHTVADVARSTAILRDSGFKLCYHMMPGLFAAPRQDIGYFKKLFSDPRFRPDMLKIYPVLVLQGTPLYAMWKSGEFSPYSTGEAAEVIAQATRFIPPYVRVSRIQRDIPSPIIQAGVKHSNLRQIVDSRLAELGIRCRCIRCREIGGGQRKGETTGRLELEMTRLDYNASNGKEVFLAFEDKEKNLLAAFLRLRLHHSPRREELAGSSIVRELHVYGQEAAIGERSAEKMQHKGLGGKLLAEAESITDGAGLGRISVLSGPGARGYYRKSGYSLAGPYMQKKV